MNCGRVATVLCCLALGVMAPGQSLPAAEQAPQKEEDRVHEQVKDLLNAVFKADVDTVLKYTHPIVIEMMGGRASAEKGLKAALGKVLNDGLKFEEFTFPAPPTFLKGTDHEFVIVPTKMIISVKGQRVESQNYQFGARALAADEWLYIEGSRVNSKNVAKFFSDFPQDYEFPTVERKLVESPPAKAD